MQSQIDFIRTQNDSSSNNLLQDLDYLDNLLKRDQNDSLVSTAKTTEKISFEKIIYVVVATLSNFQAIPVWNHRFLKKIIFLDSFKNSFGKFFSTFT